MHTVYKSREQHNELSIHIQLQRLSPSPFHYNNFLKNAGQFSYTISHVLNFFLMVSFSLFFCLLYFL